MGNTTPLYPIAKSRRRVARFNGALYRHTPPGPLSNVFDMTTRIGRVLKSPHFAPNNPPFRTYHLPPIPKFRGMDGIRRPSWTIPTAYRGEPELVFCGVLRWRPWFCRPFYNVRIMGFRFGTVWPIVANGCRTPVRVGFPAICPAPAFGRFGNCRISRGLFCHNDTIGRFSFTTD